MKMNLIGVATRRLRAIGWRFRGARIGGKNLIGCRLRLNRTAGLSTGLRVQLEHDVNVKLVGADGVLILEDYVFVGNHVQFDLCGALTVGADSMIAPGVFISDHGHGIVKGELIRCQNCELQPVVIGRDVWIGAKAIILPGVNLRDGTVVGAGAVVTRSTEENSIVAGVPARKIGDRRI